MPRKSDKCQNKEISSQVVTTEKTSSSYVQTIEEIFMYENPTIKDILFILKEILSSLQFMTAKYDELTTKNLELEITCSKLKNENTLLKTEINEIKQDVQKLEEISCERKIEVHGIPYNENEDLNMIIANISENLDYKIEREDIDEAYRIKKLQNRNNGNKNFPIVVSFVRKSIKEKFLAMRKKRSMFTNEIGFKEKRSQIYLNEYLPRKKKDLLWKTKQAKLEKRYKFLWVRNGNIMVRKTEDSNIIKINCEEDIKKIN